MNSRSLWLVLAIAIGIAAVLGWMRFQTPAAAPGNLAGSSLGGPFTLTDQDGRRVSDSQFAGQYRLIYFGYTFCPDVCPTDLAILGRGLAAFERQDAARGARVQPLFFTVDPQRDTPAAIKPFVAAFHPRLIGLTGTEAETDAVAKRFGVYHRKVDTSDPENYLVDHFAVIYLFGPAGEPIAFLPHGATAADVTQMLVRHVR